MATADDIYNAIKAHELDFPIPMSSQTIVIGTFDVAHGSFNGYVTETENIADEGWLDPRRSHVHRPPPTVKVPAVITANAVNVMLVFKSTVAGVEVTANGTTVSSPGTEVSIDARGATKVTWSITSAGKTYHDVLEIDWAPIIGVGAFVIPVLPVAVVYEPPSDVAKKNQASYSRSHAISTTIKISMGNGTTKAFDGNFLTLANLGTQLSSIGALLKNFSQATATPARHGAPASPGPGAGAGNWLAVIGGAIQLFVSLIGSTTETHSNDVTITNSHALSIKNIVADTVTTGAQDGGNFGGPGTGDIFYVLRNARVIWAIQNGSLYLTLLDFASEATIGVMPLKAGGGSIGLDRSSADAILAIDPFVADGPGTVAQGGRFVHIKTCEIDQAPGRHDFSLMLTKDEDVGTTTVTTTVDTKQEREGWLGFLGIGPSANQTTKTTVTNTQATDTDTTDTTVATLSLFSNGTEPAYAVEVMADTVFGTFAFRTATIASEPRVAGTVLDASGQPRAGAEVTLHSGSKIFSTISDAKGQFRFRSTDIATGSVAVRAGTQEQVAWLTRTALTNIELKANAS